MSSTHNELGISKSILSEATYNKCVATDLFPPLWIFVFVPEYFTPYYACFGLISTILMPPSIDRSNETPHNRTLPVSNCRHT